MSPIEPLRDRGRSAFAGITQGTLDALGLGLAASVPDAAMDRWMLVSAAGETSLFGYVTLHPLLGGLSWARSTPVVALDRRVRRARTRSGRLYVLGRRVPEWELDEEGNVALRLLVHDPGAEDPASERDRVWLVASKMARHLDADAPPRDDHLAVQSFVRQRMRTYLALRARKRPLL